MLLGQRMSCIRHPVRKYALSLRNWVGYQVLTHLYLSSLDDCDCCRYDRESMLNSLKKGEDEDEEDEDDTHGMEMPRGAEL